MQNTLFIPYVLFSFAYLLFAGALSSTNINSSDLLTFRLKKQYNIKNYVFRSFRFQKRLIFTKNAQVISCDNEGLYRYFSNKKLHKNILIEKESSPIRISNFEWDKIGCRRAIYHL